MRDPSFPTFCALGAVLMLLPLPWHLKARNSGTLIHVGWTFSACVVFFINSIIWAGNVDDIAPVWCDIASRFVIALSVGLPASSLCIQRRLYRVATTKGVSILRDNARKHLITDLLIGIGLPMLIVALYYVVQPARYLVIEDIGCWPGALNMVMTVFMVRIWATIVSFASFVYACLTIYSFIQTRRQFSQVLSESGADLNLSRFFRLMAVATTDMAFSLPLSLYFMIANMIFYPVEPWVSWDETHSFINEVWIVSYEDIRSIPSLKISYSLNLWLIPGCAFLFFMFFGLSSEVVNGYQRMFRHLMSFISCKWHRLSRIPGEDRTNRAVHGSQRMENGLRNSGCAPTNVTLVPSSDRPNSVDHKMAASLQPDSCNAHIGDLEAQV